MASYKYVLLAGAAGVALMGAAPASAFDKVNWEWDATIDELITKRITIRTDLDPDGLVKLEGLQVFIGNVNARSDVRNIDNNAPRGGNGGTAEIDFTVTLNGRYSDTPRDDNTQPFIPAQSTATLGGDLSGTGSVGRNPGVNEAQNTVGTTMTFENVEVAFDPPAPPRAAEDLPEVISSATAVANNMSIETNQMVELHSGQFAFGGFGDGLSSALSTGGGGSGGGNAFHDAALGLTFAGAFGLISPADIRAVSNVRNIKNATVDSTATAVANNLSVDVASATADAVFIGDATQFAYADVTARSRVRNVDINNYALGDLGRPIVNSVATAVGNNMSIKVMGPVTNGGGTTAR